MINKHAIVETDAIGSNVKIGEFSIIRNGVILGNNVIIHPHVIIEPGVTIGDGVEIFPGSYLGKTPKGAGATARPISFRPEVFIDKDCAIGPNAILFYDVQVGYNTLLGDGVSLREQVRVGHHCLISRYVTVNYNTTIGNHTRIMDLSHITGNVKIGNNVFISILVSTTNDNIVIKREYDEAQILGPQIEDGVTIGAGACLLPGVVIGEGAFVGAGAVVTKNINPYDLVMGIPARMVRNLKDNYPKV
jgi:acetyltransferase-like isoleucine patch superfamily enzyme